MLAKSTIKTLAYVSCNPVSFARDAKILTDAGYSLEAVTPVDQFRWSYHVELVGAFHKPAAWIYFETFEIVVKGVKKQAYLWF